MNIYAVNVMDIPIMLFVFWPKVLLCGGMFKGILL